MADRTIGQRALPSFLALAAIVVLALLPNLGPEIRSENQAVQALHGRIESISARTSSEPLRPPIARVRLLDGPNAGGVTDAYLEGPGGSQIVANYQPGDEVVVTVTADETGQPHVAVSDRWRAPLLGGFLLIFAAAVVVVGGLRGVRALLSLGLTIAVILKILIPLVINGVAPVPLAVLTATFVTVVTIGLTEGWSRTSAAAILGTAGALALTGLLAAASTALASFTYSSGSDLAFLQTADGQGLDLRGLLLSAFILGSVGVLDDVTVTQAALVGSLSDHGARGRGLIESALDVGRSHIAATVNTLFLAYVGAGLPLIVTILVSNQPQSLVLNSEEVATEVIRTIVGSLGIIAAVPFTTFVAAALVEPRNASDRTGALRRLVATGCVIAIALAATALLPLGQRRGAIPGEVFGPSSVPADGIGASPGGGVLPSDASAPTPDASASVNGDPPILGPGDTSVVKSQDTSATVTIVSVKASRVSGSTKVTLEVNYTNDGPGQFAIDPLAWSLITSSGELVQLAPGGGSGLQAQTLAAGESRGGTLAGAVRATPDEAFIEYTDDTGATVFVVPANGS